VRQTTLPSRSRLAETATSESPFTLAAMGTPRK
jgi:hypothetical protein